MRKITLILSALLCLWACSDDDKTMPQVQFPDTQIVNCTAGEQTTVTFDAAADWKLTSSANWCKFVQDGDVLLSLAGKAGAQTVTLAISDEGLTQGNDSHARLTLYMQGQQGVLAELSRSAAGYSLQVLDAEGNEVQAITVPYNDYAVFTVRANFAFAATNIPDWAELRGGWLTGAPGRDVEGAIRIVNDGTVEKNETTGTILFQDANGMASIVIPVLYDGMDRDAIGIHQPGGNAINWSLSADGRTWTHEGATYDDFVSCTIAAYHDDYEVVYVSEDAEGSLAIMPETESWLHLDQRTGRITADETGEARRAYMLAFPRATYAAISGDLAQALIDADGELTYVYAQNNLVLYVKQQAPKGDEPGGITSDEVGFIALCFDQDWNMIEVECHRVVDKSLLDHCETIAGTRDVFMLDFRSPRGHFDMVTPYPYLSTIDALDPERLWFYDNDGNRLEDPQPEAMFADSSNPPCWSIMGCANSDAPLIMPIYNGAGEAIKALYIKTAE